MKTIYYPEEDILYLRFNDKPIVREVSHGWNVNMAYAADEDLLEMTILDAQKEGMYPIQTEGKKAAWMNPDRQRLFFRRLPIVRISPCQAERGRVAARKPNLQHTGIRVSQFYADIIIDNRFFPMAH